MLACAESVTTQKRGYMTHSSGSKISSITALQYLDSRGFPTVGAHVFLEDGSCGEALVPSGASTGEFEAHELRDGDSKRFAGKGVTKAVAAVNGEIAKALKGKDALEMRSIDADLIALDGSGNKSRLGANAILAVSLAVAHAAAHHRKIPLFEYLGGKDGVTLPIPLVNVINGGAHAANSLDFQEFMLVPHSGESFAENIRMATEVFHLLRKNLAKRGMVTAVGDEGGVAPDLKDAEEAITLLVESISAAGYSPGKDISIALDVAASELFDDELGCYVLKKSSQEKLSADDLISIYAKWCDKFPLVSIEDGLDENDWEGWKKLTAKLGSKVQLVGDDLFVTNKKRLTDGISRGCANSILIKLNQIGTLSETLETIEAAKKHGYTNVISHRSGETEDCTIADLAVAVNAGQIKTGSVCRGERTAKYNRLLWIENHLGKRAKVHCFINRK